MNRYMLYKELKEILEMCRETGFDLYSWDKNGEAILSEACEIIQALQQYRNDSSIENEIFNLWITKEGPCLISHTRNEINIEINSLNEISYSYYGIDDEIHISKEKIPEILKRWQKEIETWTDK